MYFSTLIAVFASTLYAQLGVSALWPQPQQYQPGTKFMKLAPNFIINFTYGLENPVWDLDCMESPSSLCNLLFQTLYTLKMPNATQRVPQRLVSAADLDKDKQALQSAPQLSVLYLRYPNQDTRNLPEDELWHIFTTMDQRKQAEAYQLSVSLNGTAVITANSSLGMLRGLATFAQLWYINSDNDIYTVEAPVDIADSPAYAYRGLMLDTARNFIPVADITRLFDAMRAVKLNFFHWHIVDSQAFPFGNGPDGRLTNIARNSSYSLDWIYSIEAIDGIITYGAKIGIDVLVEFSMPGHTAAISHLNPGRFACASPNVDWITYAQEPPAGQFLVTSDNTTEFAQMLLKDAADVFVNQSLFSIGGNDINIKCYNDDKTTQTDLLVNDWSIEEAIGNFTAAMYKTLTSANKTTVVWDDAILAYNSTSLGDDVIVVVQKSQASSDTSNTSTASTITNKGFKIIHAEQDYFDLACGLGPWLGNLTENGGRDKCGAFQPWFKTYMFDPLGGIAEDHQKLVLGGESLIWSEVVDGMNLDSVVWPRAATTAEIFWTGRNSDSPNNTAIDSTTLNDALSRLHDLRFRLVASLDVNASPLQPYWCAINKGQCQLTF